MNQKALLEWYAREQRDLPFRHSNDPYRIWISEIMSQQTRIEAMLDHYRRFLEQFPDLPALARADDDALMKAWQGLGYYSRARNLKKAAMVCMEKFDGQLPRTYPELLSLPGIGEYTAGAIASIAYGQRIPAIDGNVIRVYARLERLEDDFSQTRAKKALRERVLRDLPEEKNMPHWTQALMELGARVCTPAVAYCRRCPLSSECQSAFREDAASLPNAKKKAARKVEEREVIIQAAWTEKGWALKLQRRPERGLLAGLYDFGSERPAMILETFDLSTYRHVFSHREWAMHGWLVLTEENGPFVPVDTIETSSAIPSAYMPFYQKAMEILNGKTGENGAVRSGWNAAVQHEENN